MARVRIVPFRCEEWGGEFAEPAGGLCRSCSRLLCKKHLVLPPRKHIRLREAPPPLCTTCHAASNQLKADRT